MSLDEEDFRGKCERWQTLTRESRENQLTKVNFKLTQQQYFGTTNGKLGRFA